MKRIIELDGLRGLFCFGVVVYHVKSDWLFWYWSAMDWFFMLSGFVITANLIQNRQANNLLSMFFLRRALRIWPLYYLALVIGLLIFIATRQVDVWGAVRSSSWLQHALFVQFVEGYLRPADLQSYLDAYPFHLRHTWSLGVEEQFYILWSVAFVVFRRSRWIVPATAFVFIVAGLISHQLHLHLYLLTGHMDAFGAGLLLAWLFVGQSTPLPRRTLAWIFALSALASVPLWIDYVSSGYRAYFSGGDSAPPGHGPWTNFGFILLWFALTGSVALAPARKVWALLRARTAVYLGEMCYSLYLAHYPAIVIAIVIARKLGYDPVLCAGLGALVGITTAHFLHQWVEQPLLKRKVTLRYRYDSPQPAGSAGAPSKA